MTGLAWENQSSAFLVALGHSGTHWIIGIIYIVLPFISKELRLSYADWRTDNHFSCFSLSSKWVVEL